MQTFSVTIRVDAEQVEKLKLLTADLNAQGGTFKDWKDYARTCAEIGFQEWLKVREPTACIESRS